MIGCAIGVLLCMFCVLVVLLVRGVRNNPNRKERSLCTPRRSPPTPYGEIEKKGLSCATNAGESLRCYLPFNLIFVPQCCIHVVLINKIWIVYKCCILRGGKAWACMLAAGDDELDGWGDDDALSEVAEGRAENTQFLAPTTAFMIAHSLTIQRKVKNVISYGFRDWDIVSTNC